MPVQVIEWMKGLFKPALCGICDGKLGADHGVIYFKAIDYADPQEMKVCVRCLAVLEDSHQAAKKMIDNEKKVMNAESV